MNERGRQSRVAGVQQFNGLKIHGNGERTRRRGEGGEQQCRRKRERKTEKDKQAINMFTGFHYLHCFVCHLVI